MPLRPFQALYLVFKKFLIYYQYLRMAEIWIGFLLYYIHWTESESVTGYKYFGNCTRKCSPMSTDAIETISGLLPGLWKIFIITRSEIWIGFFFTLYRLNWIWNCNWLQIFRKLYQEVFTDVIEAILVLIPGLWKNFIITMSQIWNGFFVILYPLNWIWKCNWLQIFRKLYQEVFPDVHWCHWGHFRPYTWPLKNFLFTSNVWEWLKSGSITLTRTSPMDSMVTGWKPRTYLKRDSGVAQQQFDLLAIKNMATSITRYCTFGLCCMGLNWEVDLCYPSQKCDRAQGISGQGVGSNDRGLCATLNSQFTYEMMIGKGSRKDRSNFKDFLHAHQYPPQTKNIRLWLEYCNLRLQECHSERISSKQRRQLSSVSLRPPKHILWTCTKKRKIEFAMMILKIMTRILILSTHVALWANCNRDVNVWSRDVKDFVLSLVNVLCSEQWIWGKEEPRLISWNCASIV